MSYRIWSGMVCLIPSPSFQAWLYGGDLEAKKLDMKQYDVNTTHSGGLMECYSIRDSELRVPLLGPSTHTHNTYVPTQQLLGNLRGITS